MQIIRFLTQTMTNPGTCVLSPLFYITPRLILGTLSSAFGALTLLVLFLCALSSTSLLFSIVTACEK